MPEANRIGETLHGLAMGADFFVLLEEKVRPLRHKCFIITVNSEESTLSRVQYSEHSRDNKKITGTNMNDLLVN